MRNLIIPSALIAGLLMASVASAATPPAKPTPVAAAASTKRAACEKEWRMRSPRPAHERAFVKACVAKG